MKKEKTTQFLMKPKVDFCFKELMEDEEVRNAFLAAVRGKIPRCAEPVPCRRRGVYRRGEYEGLR